MITGSANTEAVSMSAATGPENLDAARRGATRVCGRFVRPVAGVPGLAACARRGCKKVGRLPRRPTASVSCVKC